MSGARLYGSLGELGYEELDPDSFEWPFQYDNARPCLNWLCSNLRPTNVLSPLEVSQYEQFLQDGKFLEGDDLDFAYDSISAFSTRRDIQEAFFGVEEGLKEISWRQICKSKGWWMTETISYMVLEILSIYSNARAGLPTYVSAPGIIQQISRLQSCLMTLQCELENLLPEDRNRCLSELCAHIQS